MKKRQNAISYWIMVMPALVWLVLVNIVPMGGVVMAFQDFNPGKGNLPFSMGRIGKF